MATLESFLNDYATLESQIRPVMIQLFSEACSLCTACCCRVDICEEAHESTFLSLLLSKQGLSVRELDDRFGWLDLDGCSLEYGRPPVCYAYFCDELLARLPDEQSRWVARMLGRLIEYVGEDAFQRAHLVEISNPAVLEEVDFHRLNVRLEEARTAFEMIQYYLETGLLPKAERDFLKGFERTDS